MAVAAVPDGSKPARSGLVLSALILGAIAANMNLGIANVALPTIGRELDADQAQLTAVANTFILGLACSVLYFGALGDRYGRKKMFLLGAFFSIPTALLSAFSPNVETLIFARFLAGLAAGLLFLVTVLGGILAVIPLAATAGSLALMLRPEVRAWYAAR